MSTITKEFTKEQLIARINQVTAINKYRISRDPDADGLAMDNELFAIALASLEAKPVAYADPQAFRNFQTGVARREWMWANPDAGLIPLHTAPPSPVAVPEGYRLQPISEYDAMCAAMLQGAENSESRCTIKTAPVLDSLTKNAESRCGNSPVIQDGWVLVPEEPTHEMLEAGDEQFGTYDVYRRMIAASPQQK